MKTELLNNLKDESKRTKLREFINKFDELNNQIKKQNRSTKIKYNENVNRFNKLKEELIKTIEFEKPVDTSDEFSKSFSSSFEDIIKESISRR